ncbi:hypothetical protein MKW98_029405 [Papaver atlanticum]|uniref:Uncharacterized protein n=1 Tax=Papaver atlanticum TaxID=357466 RepID=A0AAD4SJD5_9MAGN|nr:hypothetical protein MKW98_029405 [Papaver atlanticum]
MATANNHLYEMFKCDGVDGGRNGPSYSCCCGRFEDVHRGGEGLSGCGGFEDAAVGDFEDVDGAGNGPNCCDGFADADGGGNGPNGCCCCCCTGTWRSEHDPVGSLRFTNPDPRRRLRYKYLKGSEKIQVNCFHALRRSEPSFVPCVDFVKQGLSSLVGEADHL